MRFFFPILVFEPEDNEDNEKEYQTLHGEYKNLVSQYAIKTIYLELLWSNIIKDFI